MDLYFERGVCANPSVFPLLLSMLKQRERARANKKKNNPILGSSLNNSVNGIMGRNDHRNSTVTQSAGCTNTLKCYESWRATHYAAVKTTALGKRITLGPTQSSHLAAPSPGSPLAPR